MAAITLTSGGGREEEVGGMEAQGSQLLVAVHTVGGGAFLKIASRVWGLRVEGLEPNSRFGRHGRPEKQVHPARHVHSCLALILILAYSA